MSLYNITTPIELIEFWFRNVDIIDSISYYDDMMPLWFNRKSEYFESMQIYNQQLINQVLTSDSIDNSWNNSSSTTILAKIILFDQFPRSCFRGTAKAFQYDNEACKLALEIIQNNLFFKDYSAIERLFLLMPFTHSESLELQKIGYDYGLRIAEDKDETIINFYKNLKGFPNEHYEVIQKFGRFPSRNDALVSFSFFFHSYDSEISLKLGKRLYR